MTKSLKSALGGVLTVLVIALVMQNFASAQSANAHENRIVGVFDTQVAIINCNTGATLTTFKGLNKFELGGTAQVVPSTNPTALSAHVGVWSYVAENRYKLTFKMFRFDGAGNNIGSQVVRFDLAISDDATQYAGSGKSELFDLNGNIVGASCPTIMGTRFQ